MKNTVPKRNDVYFSARAWLVALMMIGTGLLTACGKQPPGCADQELGRVATSIFQKALEAQIVEIAKRDNGLAKKYISEVKVDFQNSTDEGYNKETKKRLCKGKLVIKAPSNNEFSLESGYFAQVTSDGKDVLLGIEKFNPVQSIGGLYEDMFVFVGHERFKGSWNGALMCGGYAGELDGERGPFTQPITVIFNGSNISIDRKTRAGGLEKLTGLADLGSGIVLLSGEGQNSPEDKWFTKYEGSFSGKVLKLAGEIKAPDRLTVLRTCKIELIQDGPIVLGNAAPAVQSAVAVSQNLAASPVPSTKILPNEAARPSFDCAKASTPVEQAICGAPELARLDAALAENYRNINNSNIADGARADLKLTQRQWAAERNKCSTNQCINAAYRIRLDKVCEYPVLSGAHPPCTSANEIK